MCDTPPAGDLVRRRSRRACDRVITCWLRAGARRMALETSVDSLALVRLDCGQPRTLPHLDTPYKRGGTARPSLANACADRRLPARRLHVPECGDTAPRLS